MRKELIDVMTGYGVQRSEEDILDELSTYSNSVSNEGIYESDYYQQISEHQEELLEKQQKYTDLTEQIIELQERINEAKKNKDKKEVKELKAELKELKAERKQYKLSSLEKKVSKLLKNQMTAIDEMVKDTSGEIIDLSITNTAQYQSLLQKIGKLENKTKLTKKEKKALQMYQDELAAINRGVMTDQLSQYMSIYEKWWKLDQKSTRTKEENKQYRELSEKKLEIEDTYRKNKEALDEELKAAQEKRELEERTKNQSERDIANLESSKEREIKETNESYDDQIKTLKNEYKLTTSKAYSTWLKEYNDITDKIETYKQKKAKAQSIIDDPNAKKSKKKTAKEDLEKAEKQLTKLYEKQKAYNEELAAFEKGATSVNFDAYKKAYEYVKEADEYFKKNAKYKNKTQYDIYKEQLRQWDDQKALELKALEDQRKEAIESIARKYTEKINEIRQGLNGLEEDMWSYLKEALELQITNLEKEAAYFEAVASRYKAAADIIADTDIATIKKYNLAEILGINTDDSVEKILEENLRDAVASAKQKLSYNSQMYEEYTKLIDASVDGDFSEIITDEFRNDLSDDARLILDEMLEKAKSNDWDNNEWKTAWVERRAQLLADVQSDINSIQEFQAALREKVLFKSAIDAIENLDTLNSKLKSMDNLIMDEWLKDIDGNLTEAGLAKVALLTEQYSNAQEKVIQAQKHIQDVIAAEDTYEGNHELYVSDLNSAYQDYYNQLSDVEGIASEIYRIGKEQEENQIKLLEKEVNLRKQALQSRKEIYEYDKNIRNQTKNIESLEAQLAALNDVNTAQSKAQEKQLKEQLADAKEQLEETKKEHLFDMQINALDQLIEKMNESLENSAKSIEETFEYFAKILEDTMGAAASTDPNNMLTKIYNLLMGINSASTFDGSILTDVTPTVSSDIANNNLVPIDTDLGDESSLATPLSGILVDSAAIAKITNSIEKSGVDITSINTRQDEYTKQMLTLIRSINDRLDVNLSSISDAINNKQLIANITINGQNANVTYNGMRTASGTAPSYH